MDWITYKKKHMQPLIAKKRIEVVKVVKLETDENGNVLVKPLQFNDGTIYDIDKAEHRELNVSLEKFEVYKFFNEKYNTPRPDELLRIKDGLHSFNKKFGDALFSILPETETPTTGILRCYIPKGATYYLNEHGEYVSNIIIPDSLLYSTVKPHKRT